MSAGGMGGREVAYRLFAAEYNDSEYSYSESDEERAPNYVITPTGARANRVFVVGVLTEVEQVGNDILRGRVVDPTGAFVLYAGQYQPDEQAFLEAATPPTFVAVTGKARTFEPDDSDQVFTSIRPESINEVDADTRDRWTVQAAERTLERIGNMATACSLSERGEALEHHLRSQGISERDAQGIALAVDYYGTTPTYLAALRDVALDAAGVVAGQTDEVDGLSARPDEQGTVTADAVRASLESVMSESALAAEPVEREQDTTELMTGSSETAQAETTVDEPAQTAGHQESTPEAAGKESEPAPAESEPAASESNTIETENQGTTADVSADLSTTETEPAEKPKVESEERPSASGTETATEGEDDIGDFDPAEFDIPEEEREQVKEEFGTEFQTGTEVDEPGAAEIDTPEPPAEDVETGVADNPPAEAEPTSETEATETDETTGEEPEDVQEAVVDMMRELDEGTGADRDELLAEMNNRYGLDEGTVEDAIEDALMAGQCYEPDDSTVTPI